MVIADSKLLDYVRVETGLVTRTAFVSGGLCPNMPGRTIR